MGRLAELLAFAPSKGERLLTEDVDPLGKELNADRRVQVVGERQDHGVDTSHDLPIVAKRNRAEAMATP